MLIEKTSTVESLLGVLSLEPMSGYQMRRFIETSTANFWSESFGQIYPALKKMLADGLVEVEAGSGEGHPSRKVYRITEAGRRHLHDWLAVPARPHGNRIELLLKLFFGDKAAPAVMRAQVDAAKARAIADLHRYQAMRDRIEADCASHPGMPYWRMTLRFGIAEAHATVQWADETLQELESLDSKA